MKRGRVKNKRGRMRRGVGGDDGGEGGQWEERRENVEKQRIDNQE